MYITTKKKSHFLERRKKLKTSNKQEVAEVPKNTLVELTNACNHACVFCYNPKMKRKISSLSLDKFVEFTKKCQEEGVEEIGLYATGEPFMTKNLDKYIYEAKRIGMKRVYITTNGALAKIDNAKRCIDAGLDSIKFSINAGTKESYKVVHGHDDFDNVLLNIKNIYEYKVNNNLNLQLLSSFVFTNLTKSEIKIFKKTFGKYLEEMIFFPAGNQGGRNIDTAKNITSELNNIKKDNNYQPCEMLWNRLHLTSEGYLTACCVDYENDLTYKKFNSGEKIYDQFNNTTIRSLRKKHLENNLENTICNGCIYNTNENYTKLADDHTVYNKPNDRKLKQLKERIFKINK